MIVLRCTTNTYMKTKMRYVLKCIPNFDVYDMNMHKTPNQMKHFQRKVV